MYNKWYLDTYDEILKMADWSRFDVEVSRKVVCIFSWMPQTIMGLKAKGGKNFGNKSLLKKFNLSFRVLSRNLKQPNPRISLPIGGSMHK